MHPAAKALTGFGGIDMDRQFCCCFTGHRIIEYKKINEVKRKIKTEIMKMIDHGVTHFINGAALGFDMLCAECVIEIKMSNNALKDKIHLILYVPCTNHNKNWSYNDKLRYNMITCYASEIIYVTKSAYTTECMKKRNYRMVDDSAYCIAYFTGRRSGTMQTVNYAKKNNLTIINIASS